jgi:hypothetical protein
VNFHGTLQGYYQHRCRCEYCGPVGRKYAKARRTDAQLGRPRTVDGALVRGHVDRLVAAGMSRASIAQAAGYCSRTALGKIYTQDRVLRSTVERIAAVSPPQAVEYDGLLVDAIGSRRRLRALAVMGWSIRALKAHGGTSRWEDVRLGDTKRVTRATHLRVSEAFEKLAMKDAGDSPNVILVKQHAQRQGWAGPLAWDDVDDPAELPKGWKRGRKYA